MTPSVVTDCQRTTGKGKSVGRWHGVGEGRIGQGREKGGTKDGREWIGFGRGLVAVATVRSKPSFQTGSCSLISHGSVPAVLLVQAQIDPSALLHNCDHMYSLEVSP